MSEPSLSATIAATREAMPPHLADVPWLVAGIRGSHAHGTYIPPTEGHGTDDIDVFVVGIQPPRHYLTLTKEPRDTFETGGADVDILWYDARKFFRLLWQQNPNVHQWLWTRETCIGYWTPWWLELVAARESLLSRKIFSGLLGYAHGQLALMVRGGTKSRYMGAKREALLGRYGYDIKNAAHCVRLLYLARRLAEVGGLQVELHGDELDTVLAIKTGKMAVDEMRELATQLFEETHEAMAECQLPDDVPREVFEGHWLRCMEGIEA